MEKNGFLLTTPSLAPGVALVAARHDEERAVAAVSGGASGLRREIGFASALGHLLMDVNPVSVDGDWEDWPTAARARAFAIMVLMPDQGLRETLPADTPIEPDDVRAVMKRFDTGPFATTFHLRNRGFINEERRAQLLAELVKP
jgi:hypothetical protein